MGTRLHVFITVGAISLTSSGCFFFGGGDDKKHAAAVRQAKLELQQQQQQQRDAMANREDTVSKMLKPKESAVQWPDPSELRLSDKASSPTVPPPPPQNSAPAKSDRAMHREDLTAPPPVVRAMKAAPPPPAAEIIEPVEPVEPSQPIETRDAAVVAAAAVPEAPAHGAVANKGIELGDPEPAPAVVAAARTTDPAHAGATSQQRKPAPGKVDDTAAGGRIIQRLRENPTELSAHLDYQLQRFLADDAVPDLDALAPLPAEDRELITSLLDGLTNFRNGLRTDSNMLFSKKVRPLIDMVARLRSQAELSIPTIALCKGVTTYGNYEPMDGRFVAGARNETIVYCEVENVSSQQNAQGLWESKLSQEVVLYTEDGQKVWSNPPQITPDVSRNRRRDFFLAQKIALPPNLTIDRYILKFTVEDKQVGRIAEATAPVQIVASLGTPQLPSIPLTTNREPGGSSAARNQPVTRSRNPQPDAARQASERQPAPRADLPRDAVDGK